MEYAVKCMFSQKFLPKTKKKPGPKPKVFFNSITVCVGPWTRVFESFEKVVPAEELPKRKAGRVYWGSENDWRRCHFCQTQTERARKPTVECEMSTRYWASSRVVSQVPGLPRFWVNCWVLHDRNHNHRALSMSIVKTPKLRIVVYLRCKSWSMFPCQWIVW